ncbi:hypothetical protein RND81_06G045100 [Saponaria officinalis]|uniref:Major facilitator superfamily (MFS) profile domain-containing protein n=1 Tax=Saponaria officinalis TaxID=3572 RepID=A0AAW1K6J0_SAPOF
MAQLSDDAVVPGFVDYKKRPVIRSKQGGWGSAGFIIGVEMGERLTYFGVSANLIQFLTLKLGQSTAVAAANVNAWTGTSFLLPIFGALIADSLLGKYLTIIFASLIYVLGLVMLTLSATLPSLNCTNHGTNAAGKPKCSLHAQTIIFFIALYMVALGQGGHKPCVQAFGADQFDEEHPEERKAKSSFFNWWYLGVSMGSVIGTFVLSYTQDNISWGVGFGIPGVLMVIALLVFVGGTVRYRFQTKSEGPSPFKRIGKVFVTAARNWRTPHPVHPGDEEEDSQKTQRLSKSEVEEAKAVLRLIPIWLTSLVFAILIAQPPTLFTKQGATLERSITSKVKLPPATLNGIVGIFIVLFIPIYDRIIVPFARRSTGKPSGITMLQRVGVGLFISTVALAVSALVEIKRRNTASLHGLTNSPKATLPMSIWWLIPQCALLGVADAFTMVGLQEFFYDQVPDELRSVGASMYLSIMGVGSLISGALVSIIDKETGKGGKHSWLSTNLNQGHLDYFYWLLTGLSAAALLLFIFAAKSYVYNKKSRA